MFGGVVRDTRVPQRHSICMHPRCLLFCFFLRALIMQRLRVFDPLTGIEDRDEHNKTVNGLGAQNPAASARFKDLMAFANNAIVGEPDA